MMSQPSEAVRGKHPGSSKISHSEVSVEGGTLHIARVGSGNPLILLHGWPEFWFTWEPVMLLLAEHFDVIVPDLRGLGDSSKPDGPFTSKQHAADITAMLNQLGLAKVGLVSHDVGGAVAQALAQAYPARLSGLFFFTFLHPGIGDRFFALDRLANIWYMFFQQTAMASDVVTSDTENIARYFSYFLKEWAHKPECFDDVIEVFVENFRKPGNVEGGFNYYRAAMPPRTNPPDGKAAPLPPPVLLPTCVRWSQYDKLFDYAWTDTLPRFFPQLDLKQFESVGHFPHRENPRQAAHYISEFFRSLHAEGTK